MTKKSIRNKQISQEIQKKIGIILQRKINDQRIYMTNISNVILSKDIAYCKVFVTFSNIENNKNKTKIIIEKIKIINKASGFIQYLLCKSINLRITPKIFFIYDNSLEKIKKIYNLISKSIEKK
ncbi:30S ribosome-binding factor [Candidatus Providencia siddallii]|uniref:Ribosome-binding factor A n=2 Tax=Candidatus Providencia siddallii TaxID=1715285 RepID=A0ABP1CHL5_9GAMM